MGLITSDDDVWVSHTSHWINKWMNGTFKRNHGVEWIGFCRLQFFKTKQLGLSNLVIQHPQHRSQTIETYITKELVVSPWTLVKSPRDFSLWLLELSGFGKLLLSIQHSMGPNPNKNHEVRCWRSCLAWWENAIEQCTKLSCLGYFGDTGTIINHYEDPYQSTSMMERGSVVGA